MSNEHVGRAMDASTNSWTDITVHMISGVHRQTESSLASIPSATRLPLDEGNCRVTAKCGCYMLVAHIAHFILQVVLMFASEVNKRRHGIGLEKSCWYVFKIYIFYSNDAFSVLVYLTLLATLLVDRQRSRS